jgi:hypothetical protein
MRERRLGPGVLAAARSALMKRRALRMPSM